MGNLAQKAEVCWFGDIFFYSRIVNIQRLDLNEVSRDTYFVVRNQVYHST